MDDNEINYILELQVELQEMQTNEYILDKLSERIILMKAFENSNGKEFDFICKTFRIIEEEFHS